MKLTEQRGAIPITLDRPRVLFFGMNATFLLVNRYGQNFAAGLYEIETSADRSRMPLKLKSADALCFFLWAGLQEELADGEELTLDEVKSFVRPWVIRELFKALVLALTGAMYVPAAPGKESAATPAAKPAARKTAAKKTPKAKPVKRSTLKLRPGLRQAR